MKGKVVGLVAGRGIVTAAHSGRGSQCERHSVRAMLFLALANVRSLVHRTYFAK